MLLLLLEVCSHSCRSSAKSLFRQHRWATTYDMLCFCTLLSWEFLIRCLKKHSLVLRFFGLVSPLRHSLFDSWGFMRGFSSWDCYDTMLSCCCFSTSAQTQKLPSDKVHPKLPYKHRVCTVLHSQHRKADASSQADNWFTHNLQSLSKEPDFLAINEKITLLANKTRFF